MRESLVCDWIGCIKVRPVKLPGYMTVEPLSSLGVRVRRFPPSVDLNCRFASSIVNNEPLKTMMVTVMNGSALSLPMFG
jgi:hypothetical protein